MSPIHVPPIGGRRSKVGSARVISAGGSPAPAPFVGQDAEDQVVHEVVVEPLALAQQALVREAESLGHPAAPPRQRPPRDGGAFVEVR